MTSRGHRHRVATSRVHPTSLNAHMRTTTCSTVFDVPEVGAADGTSGIMTDIDVSYRVPSEDNGRWLSLHPSLLPATVTSPMKARPDIAVDTVLDVGRQTPAYLTSAHGNSYISFPVAVVVAST